MDGPPHPAPAGVLESALYADDLDAAEAFYGGILGLPRIARVGERHVFFRCGDGVVLIFNPAETETADPPSPLGVPPHGARGPGHMAFRADPPGLDAWHARLRDAGVAIESAVHWPQGGRSVYVRDPAGNSIEFAEARIWGVPPDPDD